MGTTRTANEMIQHAEFAESRKGKKFACKYGMQRERVSAVVRRECKTIRRLIEITVCRFLAVK